MISVAGNSKCSDKGSDSKRDHQLDEAETGL
jgi:hypothetical protein